MQKFLAFLLDLLTRKELSKAWLAFFLDLAMHILKSKDYELQIKSSVLKIMTILSEKEVLSYKLEALFKTLVQNINVAAQHEELTIYLLQYLLKKIDPTLIPIIFDRLLQVSHKSKNVTIIVSIHLLYLLSLVTFKNCTFIILHSHPHSILFNFR